ncbi:uncharacterized protein LOC120290568 [Eucalyptus grandis]|uniref:uncharacterized protein LOC120290568 n=1 Tax=Eucalyptus grandis TaxID=71139 RepID=UPI00192EAD20|nr:uncharacterized protein LOC120290568 [Eucalyptus grandis]
MIDYKKEGNPLTSASAIRHYAQGLLMRGFMDDQLATKVRVLKRKYNNKKGKAGEDMVFSNLHQQKIFELSEKIWGDKNGDEVEKKFVLASLSLPLSPKAFIDVLHTFRIGSWDEGFLKKGLELLQESKRAGFKERLRKLHFAEMQMVGRKAH